MPGIRLVASSLFLISLAASGCRSPYYADRGALVGGLGGAGVGALVGHAVGNTAAGAVIGGGVGALTGAVVGSGMDEIEAKNRAEIEARIGRAVPPGAVTIDEVISLTRAGVNEDLIATHVRHNGMVAPLSASDLILLNEQGVTPKVVQAMQAPPPQRATVIRERSPPPVIVEEHYYDYPGWDPYWHHHHHWRHRPCHSGVSWGVSFSD